MPLPIGHALAGMAFFETRPGRFFKNRWVDAFFFILLANLPDADFLPGLLLGFPNRYHHGIFHSLGAALAVSAIGGLIFSRAKQNAWRLSGLVFLIFSSHLLLDFFTMDFTAPFGLPLFWPFSKNYYIAGHPIFINITRSARSADFFPSLFSSHNLKAALLEIGFLGGLALSAGMVRRVLNQRADRSHPR
jgi:membrane-bound metal-dependent hydrolase YbcI (DUF457 family)